VRAGIVHARGYHIGVDLGQRRDHTAVVVVEQRVVTTGRRDLATYELERERQLVVRMVERVRLGQGYEEIAREVERLTQWPGLADGLVTTAVDATGLGCVVTENLQRKALRGELYPVVITGGLEGRYARGYFPTPRTELLVGVERAFEVGGLRVAEDVKGWEELAGELKGIRRRQSERGPRYETTGRHDDLVFGLALALFGARMRVLALDHY